MGQLLKLTLLIVLSLALLTGVAVLIGRMQPPPERLAALHLTYCAPPCWIGIMPGKTTIDEASKRIEAVYGITPAHYANEHGDQFLDFCQADDMPPITLAAQGDDVVLEVSFNLGGGDPIPVPEKNRLTLGELYSVFGEPNRFMRVFAGPALAYGNDDFGATIHMAYPFTYPIRLTWDLRPDRVTLYGGGGRNLGFRVTRQLFPWRGFATYYETQGHEE